MTACEIDYSELESAVSNVRKAKEELYDCMDFLSVKVMGKLNSLPGSDEFGNIASVQSSISTKVGTMRSKQNVLEDFVYDVDHFASMAEDADQRVADRISELAEPHKEAWSFTEAWRSVTGFFYNVFCVDIPNFFGDRSPFFESIIEFLRDKANRVSHWLDGVINHFKHGEGQYQKNIWMSGLGFIGAAFTVVGAVAAAIAGGTVVLPIIALVLGGCFIIYSFCNFAASATNNYHAYWYAKNGKKNMAHYYTGTENIVDWVKKKDFGGVKENLAWENAMTVFDVLGKTSEIGLSLITIAGSAISMGNVYGGADGKEIIDHKYSWENIKKNLLKESQETLLETGFDEAEAILPDGSKSKVYKFKPLEFLFSKEKSFLESLSSDDELKQYKAYKKAVTLVMGFFTEGESNIEKLAEQHDEFWKDPSGKGMVELFSDTISAFGNGFAVRIDDYTSDITDLGKKICDFLMPDPV